MSGPIETALSGHASAVLRVILTKETLYEAGLTRHRSGPIETALSGHTSAVLRVILTKETLCVAWLLCCISTSSQSMVDEDTRAKFRYTSS